jgi:hypothetical protein
MRLTNHILCAIALLILLGSYAHAQQPNEDRVVCNSVFSAAFEQRLIDKPIGKVVTTVGKKFLGAPYEAHTLDRPGTEQLIVNLRSFDCVTYVENVLALARAIKSSRLSFDAYRDALQLIRYRDGTVNGYASRLHYFTDWIRDNERKGIVKDVTSEIGGIASTKRIDFMTTHRSTYQQLADDSTYASMRAVEDSLQSLIWYYAPTESIRVDRIQDGDIIAVATNIAGLDISHTGIAVRQNDGRIYYMHAPNVRGTVAISKQPLADYIRKVPKSIGIVVARPVDVEGWKIE